MNHIKVCYWVALWGSLILATIKSSTADQTSDFVIGGIWIIMAIYWLYMFIKTKT